MITLTTIVSNKLTNALPLVDESIINEVQQNYLLHLRTGDDYKAALAQSNSAQSNNEPQLKDFDSVTHQATEFIYQTEQMQLIEMEDKINQDAQVNLLVNNVISKALNSTLVSSIQSTQNSSNWSYLLSVQQKADRRNLAPIRIYQEIINLKELISQQTGENVDNESFTLAIPPSHYGYLMAKNDIGISAFELLKGSIRDIKIVFIPELNNGDIGTAVLIAESHIYGKAGYFTWDNPKGADPIEFGINETVAYLTSQGRANNGESFRVDIPNYRLVITNPEQIAVLKGI